MSVTEGGEGGGRRRSTRRSVVKRYILAVDIGSTTLRSHVYDQNGSIRGTSSKKVTVLHPQSGWCEVDPERLFEEVVDCVRQSITAAGMRADQITCMGLTTQRNTFVTWNRETGVPYHKMITWQDMRARDYVEEWNRSYTMKVFNGGSKLLHFLTRRKRYLAASVLRFLSPQVSMRLLWVLDNIDGVKRAAKEGQMVFGCIETWLMWKLTRGSTFATDYSCASATGLFDPFQVEWSSAVCSLLDIPMSIFPKVLDTSGHFGECDPELFGVAIPISAVVADQQAAMFGECCFDAGDVKCTMGTGTFIDLNTGRKPHASIAGLYPLIGWKIQDELVYLAEGVASDTGKAMEWAKSIGLCEDVSEMAAMAESVEDNGGVYFVQAFSGLQAPINDDTAVTTLIGLTPNTSKAHIVRALLESVAFRFKLLYETLLNETNIPLSYIRADGGVCSNNFVMQLVSDLINQSVDRAKQADMTSLGAAFLAGLATGIWQSKDELRAIRKSDCVFKPRPTWSEYKDIVTTWERAVNRSKHWYKSA